MKVRSEPDNEPPASAKRPQRVADDGDDLHCETKAMCWWERPASKGGGRERTREVAADHRASQPLRPSGRLADGPTKRQLNRSGLLVIVR